MRSCEDEFDKVRVAWAVFIESVVRSIRFDRALRRFEKFARKCGVK